MRKKVDPFSRAKSARACSNCVALIELTWLGEPKSLCGEKLARLGRGPYFQKMGDTATLAGSSRANVLFHM